MTKYTSLFKLGDEVLFGGQVYSTKGEALHVISDRTGTIVSVRFTKAKVFYDIVDDYSADLFTEVDSADVNELPPLHV